jgi:hypothetical protein
MMSAMESTTTGSYRYGGSFLLDAVQSFQQEEKAAGSPRDELRMYLESGVEHTTDVIQWWGVRILVNLSKLLLTNARTASSRFEISNHEAHCA